MGMNTRHLINKTGRARRSARGVLRNEKRTFSENVALGARGATRPAIYEMSFALKLAAGARRP
jgi:hypothetical protein